MSPDHPPVAPDQTLTSGRRLARNAVWNLVAQGAPLGVALVAIPFLLHRIGVERFGVLTLIWALVGYASVFDFGLGRALTKLIADRLGQGKRAAIPALLWTGLSLMAGVGLIAGLLLLLIVPWLVQDALHVPPALFAETRSAFQLVALGIPFVTLAAGLRGVLEAHQRFRALALINGFQGAFTFLGPLLAVVFIDHMAAMAAAILIARALATAFYFLYCLELHPDLARPHWLKADAKSLIRFGSWMTISNLLGPLMDNMDRFLLGALATVSVVAYYVTPYDVITRSLIIPNALVGVLFPAFSVALANDRQRAINLCVTGVRYVFLALVPVCLLIVIFAREALELWLGHSFAVQSEHIAQWLAIGVVFNGLARIPYSLLQAAGRPDITARLHLAEFVVYMLMAWWLIRSFGAMGAAMAWTLRVTMDALCLYLFVFRYLPGFSKRLRPVYWVGILSLATVILATQLTHLTDKLLFAPVCVALFAWGALRWLVEPGEVSRMWSHFRPGNPLSRR